MLVPSSAGGPRFGGGRSHRGALGRHHGGVGGEHSAGRAVNAWLYGHHMDLLNMVVMILMFLVENI